MRWMEITAQTPEEETDERCRALEELGCGGVIIESERDFKDFISSNRQFWGVVDEELEKKYAGASRLKFYLADDEAGRAALGKIRARLGTELSVTYMEDSDWENNWRQNYQPVDIGEKLVVVPDWDEAPANGRIPLRLTPGVAFGTGSHPTTALALAAAESYITGGERVLDLGCGSGILGIGAILLGAKSCTGCDIDPLSPEAAAGNAKLNGIESDIFRVLAGDILADAGLRKALGGSYDMVLANIVADVIIPLSGLVPPFLKPRGIYIVSGIIEGREEETAAALKKSGFEIINHTQREEWHCFACALSP